MCKGCFKGVKYFEEVFLLRNVSRCVFFRIVILVAICKPEIPNKGPNFELTLKSLAFLAKQQTVVLVLTFYISQHKKHKQFKEIQAKH